MSRQEEARILKASHGLLTGSRSWIPEYERRASKRPAGAPCLTGIALCLDTSQGQNSFYRGGYIGLTWDAYSGATVLGFRYRVLTLAHGSCGPICMLLLIKAVGGGSCPNYGKYL